MTSVFNRYLGPGPSGGSDDACVVSVPDINECADPNMCPGEQCENTAGSYECVPCLPGHEARGGICYGEDWPSRYLFHFHLLLCFSFICHHTFLNQTAFSAALIKPSVLNVLRRPSVFSPSVRRQRVPEGQRVSPRPLRELPRDLPLPL